MGAGGKEVTLDVFEWHLKKLLHIIDKLPKAEREKAVLILRNSANHYSNLTSGHPLPPPAPCPPAIYSSIHPNQSLAEIPVSQVAKTFNLLKDENLMKNAVACVPTKDAAAVSQQQQDVAAIFLSQEQNQAVVTTSSNADYAGNSVHETDILPRPGSGDLSTMHVNTANVSKPSDIEQRSDSGKDSISLKQENVHVSSLEENDSQFKKASNQEPSGFSQMQSQQPGLIVEESESQAILDEIGRLAAGSEGTDETDGGGADGPNEGGFVEDGEDDWDQHILDGLQDVSQHSSISGISLNQSIQPLASMMNSSESSGSSMISETVGAAQVNAPSSVISPTLSALSAPSALSVAGSAVMGTSVSGATVIGTALSEGTLSSEVRSEPMMPEVSASVSVASLESSIAGGVSVSASTADLKMESDVSNMPTSLGTTVSGFSEPGTLTAMSSTGAALSQASDSSAVMFESPVVTATSEMSQNCVTGLSTPSLSPTTTFFSKPKLIEEDRSQNQCKLCFKRLSVLGSMSPQSCRKCKFQLCDANCFTHHVSECHGVAEVKPSKPSRKRQSANSEKKIEVDDRKCESCNKVFTTAYTYRTHMAAHKENDCNKCGAKCSTRKLLVAHLKTVHFLSTAVKFYDCKYCTRKFVKKPSLWFHYTSHATGTQKVCPKCGEFLDNEQLFDEHMAKHKENMLSCNLCGDIFSRKQQYEDHMKDHDKYSCDQCQKAFPSKKRLRHHKTEEHSSKGKDSAVVPKKTKEVESQDSKQKEAAKNVIAEAKKKKKSFKCGYCPFQNKNYRKVIRHERRHKGYRKFVCELCGSAFNSDHNLKEHVTYVHLEERNFKCSKCEKSFKFRNALVRHQSVHSDVRQFQCFCGKSYKRQSHLNRHFASSSHGYESGYNNRSIIGGLAYSGSIVPVTCQTSDTFTATNNQVTSVAGNAAGQLPAVHANTSLVHTGNEYMMGTPEVMNNMKQRKNVGEMSGNMHMEFYSDAPQCQPMLDKKLGEYDGANLDMLDTRLNKQQDHNKFSDSLPSMMMNQQMPTTSSHVTDDIMVGKDFRKQSFSDNYEKLRHYKIPKKYSGQTRYDPYQKYTNVRDLPQQQPMQYANNVSRQNQFNKFANNEGDAKSAYPGLPCIQNQGQRMFNGSSNQANYDRNDCNTGDRLPVLFSEEERDILRGYPGDRMDYTSGAVMLPDKLSAEYDNSKAINNEFYSERHENRGGYYDKNNANAKGVDKIYNEKLYFQDKPFVDQKDLQLADRNNCYDRGYMDSKGADKHPDRSYAEDQRNYYDKSYLPLDIPSEFLLNPLDCGPADLTVANKDVQSGSNGINTNVDAAGEAPGAAGRDDYLGTGGGAMFKPGVKSRGTGHSANMMEGGIQQRPGGFAGMGGRQVDPLRGEIDDLVSLEETYRSSQDLGHTGRQSLPYYETLESFNVLPSRGGATENRDDEFDKRHKFIKQDKYSRCDDYMGTRQDPDGGPPRTDYLNDRHNPTRQDYLDGRQDDGAGGARDDYMGGRHDPTAGGSLPPLLALNPSLGGTEPISPPAQNYMCNNETENINPPYILPESGLEYY